MKHKLLFLILAVSMQIKAQEVQGNRLFSGNINNLTFFRYPDKVQIKAILRSQSEAKCLYPEDLQVSVMSCSNPVWEAYHTLGGKTNADIKESQHYEFIQKMDKDKNYFELKHKFEFKIMGIETAVIKFYLITEQSTQPQAGVTTMQKIDGRWQICSMKMCSKLAMLALRLKSEKISEVINGNTADRFLLEVHRKIFDGDILNFDKFSSLIDSWYSDDSKENKAFKTYFKDPNSLF